MRLSGFSLTLPLLLALTSAHAAPAAAPAPPATRPSVARPASSPGDAAARKALEGVVARYRTLRTYRLQGQATTEVTGAQVNNATATSVSFLVGRPDRFVSHVRNTEMNTRMVADGESLWTAVAELGQYQAQSLVTLRAGQDSATMARQLDPAGDYARLLEGVTLVRALGPDTVLTAHGVVKCQRYAITAPRPVGDGITVHPRVLWVDPATRMVLLDSIRVDQKHPQMGELRSVSLTRMIVAEADPVLAADAFAFHPDPELRRVRRFMQTSPEHAAMEGQPAPDFTLETLADATPVQLSGLRGKVVMLDFWATWCGPCRGWMPIVDKVRQDLAEHGLVVYAVNEREAEPKVRDYLTKQKLEVPVLMDRSGSVGAMYRANSIPLTVVVGRDGRVVRVLLGLHGEDDLREVLREAGIE